MYGCACRPAIGAGADPFIQLTDYRMGLTIVLFTSPMTVMSELFWVTNATTACGSIARFLMRATISCCTSAGVSYRRLHIVQFVGRTVSQATDAFNSAVGR